MRGACCSWPRPTRSAIWRWCGGRRSGSASPSRPRRRSNRTAWWRSGPVWCSVIRWFARRCTGQSGADERSEVHRALAEATDPDIDPDRRAWHRAQAAAMPDEEVAAELERSAARAQARGGFAAAAAFLERSSVLTLDPARRAGRALAAAQATQQAGALDEALMLAESADAGPLDEFQRAQVDVLRARISFATDRGSEAPRLLLTAAKRLEPLDTRLARELYLDALTAALFAGRLGGAGDARHVATAARAAPPSAPPPRAADLLLDGLAVLISEGHGAGTPILRKALRAFHRDEIGTEEGLRWLWLAGRAAGFIWDYEGWDSLTTHQIRAAREVGALAHLPLAFSTRVGVHIFAGELAGGRVAGRGGGRPRRGHRWSHRPPVRGPRAGRLPWP